MRPAPLVAAVKSGMKQDVLKVLGADGEDIVDSGDDVADADARTKFLSAYDAKHSLKVDGRRASLIIGADDFPFRFRSSITGTAGNSIPRRPAGVLYRRIGRNELDAIQTCLAFVDAEHEYAEKDRGDGVGTYAQKNRLRSRQERWPLLAFGQQTTVRSANLPPRRPRRATRRRVSRGPITVYYYRILTSRDRAPRAAQ